jgi:hypothetical protein
MIAGPNGVMNMERQGGCACGAVRFTITAPLAGVGACHCRDCQKASGGGPNYVALARRDAFIVTKGEPRIHRGRADSGAETGRAFCPDCGTPLWSLAPDLPFIPVKVGALDERDDLAPQMHIYVSSAPPWHPFCAGSPRFEKMPPTP